MLKPTFLPQRNTLYCSVYDRYRKYLNGSGRMFEDTISDCCRRESSMSVAVAIVGHDGIVVASDDCTTVRAGASILHYGGAKKIWKVKDRYRLLAVNNNEGFSRWIIETFKEFVENTDASYMATRNGDKYKELLKQIDSCNALCLELSTFIKGLYKDYELDTETLKNTDMFDLGFTLVGYDREGGKPIARIYWLSTTNSFVPVVQRDFNISGISAIGNYYMNKLRGYLFKECDERTPKVGVEVLKKIVALIIIETSKYTENVSNKIIMEIIKPDGIIKVDDSEIKKITSNVSRITNDSYIARKLGII